MPTPGVKAGNEAGSLLGLFLHYLDSSHARTLPNTFYNQLDSFCKNVIERSLV